MAKIAAFVLLMVVLSTFPQSAEATCTMNSFMRVSISAETFSPFATLHERRLVKMFLNVFVIVGTREILTTD